MESFKPIPVRRPSDGIIFLGLRRKVWVNFDQFLLNAVEACK